MKIRSRISLYRAEWLARSGRHLEALEKLAATRQHARDTHDLGAESWTLRQIADSEEALGNIEAATRTLEDALSIDRKRGCKTGELAILRGQPVESSPDYGLE